MSLLEQRKHPIRNLRYYLLVFVATVFLIYWVPIPTILGGVSDDALFYPKIASNLVDGYGSTFDRLQPTNGYHPLWMLILAGLFSLLKLGGITSPEELFRAALVLNAAIFLLCLDLSLRILDRAKGKLPDGWTKPVLLLFLVVFPFSAGWLMEPFPLVLFVLLSILSLCTGRLRFLYLLGPLIFLCRIDSLPFIAVLLLFAFLQDRKTALKAFGVVVSVVALYFGYNWYEYGHFLTVSASIKAQMGERFGVGVIELAIAQVLRQKNRLIFLAGFFLLNSLLFFLNFRRGSRRRPTKPISPLLFTLSCTGLVYLSLMFFLNGNVRPWYLVLPFVLTGLSLFSEYTSLVKDGADSQLKPGLRAIARSFLPMTTVLSLATLTFFVFGRGWENRHYGYALWVKDRIAAQDFLYQVDSAGVIALFSDRGVISADGLVGSFPYLEQFYGGRICDFIVENRIQYLGIDEKVRAGAMQEGSTLSWKGIQLEVELIESFGSEYHLYRPLCRPAE